ncbi:MAG: methyltransferase [Bacteroidota bacterium]|nr:methyltransferase [Bacteroidota bacterium]
MDTKMTWGGIGPKLAILSLPYAILAIFVMNREPGLLNAGFLEGGLYKAIGYAWLAIGVVFWVSSALYFLHDFKAGKLITRGPYGLCRNPIYASIIVFILPALAVLFHSGMVFTIVLILYLNFKLSIHGECLILSRIYGEEYERYKKSVNEIIPFPRYLFHRNVSVH